MRILIIGPTYPFRGGISHHTSLLAKELSKKHQLSFISFHRQYPKVLFPGETDRDPSGEKLYQGEVEYIIDSINPITLIKTAKVIKSFDPELILFPWWVTFWAPHFLFLSKIVKRSTRAKIIFFCHNVVDHEANFLKIFATKMVLSNADLLITQSEDESKRVKELLPACRVKTAFHPTYADLNTRTLTPEDAQKEISVSGPTLLFFGFIRPYKGLDILIEAVSHVVKSMQVTLLVVGEFWKDRDSYYAQIKQLNLEENIKVYDRYIPNDEVATFFAAADLVVQPYKSVTGSGVCQLAYGFDKPVIATDLGSLREIIETGVNGFLVPPESPEALADAIIKCLEPEFLRQLTENASQTKYNYSWERLADIICE